MCTVLWQTAPAHGATLLAAHVSAHLHRPEPREADLDPAQLDGEWPVPLLPGRKTQQGLGLLWERISKDERGHPAVRRELRTVAEVQQRIARYWAPLPRGLAGGHRRQRAALRRRVAPEPALHAQRRRPAPGRTDAPPLADFVLGDRDGTTCAREFIHLVGHTLRGLATPWRTTTPTRAWS